MAARTDTQEEEAEPKLSAQIITNISISFEIHSIAVIGPGMCSNGGGNAWESNGNNSDS